MAAAVAIGAKQLSLTNLDKVLYPCGYTKGQVISYYLRMAPAILPHLSGRAVTLKRYPNGSQAPFFFEKQCPAHRPAWVRTARVVGREGDVEYCLVNDTATLVWLANLAALELHVPLAKASEPQRPTCVAFELDPGPGCGLLECARVGLRLRELLQRLRLKSFPKTSGGKGLHVYVPLNTAATFDETKAFAYAMAGLLSRENPRAITTRMTRTQRSGRILIDWSQNDPHKTTVCVYSLRAGPEAIVSMPVNWTQLKAAVEKDRPAALTFTTEEALAMVWAKGDRFAPVTSLKQRLPA